MKYNRTPLRNLVGFISKGIAPKYARNDEKNIIRVLNQKCNRNGEISFEFARYNNLWERKVSSEKLLTDGDILINSTGTGTAGRVAQIRKNQLTEPTTVDGHMIIIRPSDDIDSEYLGYALKANQRLIESYAEGSTGQTEINRQRLLDETFINCPSMGEQKKIANMFSTLDEKIRQNKLINDNLKLTLTTIF